LESALPATEGQSAFNTARRCGSAAAKNRGREEIGKLQVR
jgi:hypothetical protein